MSTFIFASATAMSSISFSLPLILSLLISLKLSSEFYTISSTSLFVRTFLPLLCPSITPESTAERSALTENMQDEYRMLIATHNERLNYSLPIYRKNWHIYVLTSSQQKDLIQCSARVVDDEDKNLKLQMRCSIYE